MVDGGVRGGGVGGVSFLFDESGMHVGRWWMLCVHLGSRRLPCSLLHPRGPTHTARPPPQQGVAPLADVVRGDFLNMPFEKDSFDGAYAIEATCHAPKVREYNRIE